MEAPAEEAKLVATRALVIYEYDKPKSCVEDEESIIDAYITRHRVGETGDLLEGSPLTREMLLEICSLVMPTLGSVDYIPDNVLVYSPERALMWWTPAAVRRLSISEIKGVRSGEYPVPPKLFLVLKGKLHTWALGENRRPDPSSAVFHSPFYNVYETGACCMGNIRVPDRFSPDSIAEWQSVFFNGTLTSHLPPKLSGIEPEDFWKKIKGKKRFPVQYLHPYATLVTIIKAISSLR
ncbi:MAG: hypothetical protein KA801_02250 [Syntrophorhabdaceae bacterium]|nr:hypothetical protein [Syntrophorhabdaceae bacterium]